jgi:hypothetical protein
MWRFLYPLLAACVLILPVWVSGFSAGLLAVLLFADGGTYLATRRHREETSKRVRKEESP